MERAAVYRRKLNIIVEELEALPSPDAELSRLEMRGLLHAVQVAVDAAMDVVAMRLKDIGQEVTDDYHNLDALVAGGRLDVDLAATLRRLNGLRNAIVHRYNTFEEETVRESVDEIRTALFAFVERMEASL